MKIMQVLPAMQGGGVERGTIETATYLTQQNVPNVVVSAGGRMVPQLDAISVKHVLLDVGSKNPIKFVRNIYRLRAIIRQENVTIVHARSRVPAWVCHFALKKCPNVHFVTTFHGKYGTSPRWLKIPYNRVMTLSEKVIAVSKFIADHIVDTYHISKDKVRLIYRGADVDVFDPQKVADSDVQTLAKQWGVPQGKTIILMPARLTRPKGHLVVLDALSMMRHKDVVCVFVGSDHGKQDYHQELQQKIAKLDSKTEVLLENHCNQMPVAYKLSDIVISASLYPEAFGRTIVEAQSMGCIVIATKHGGAMETIDDGKTGFLVPVGDAKALAECLDKVLDMPQQERLNICHAAEQSVRDNFSIENMCKKTLAVYSELSNE